MSSHDDEEPVPIRQPRPGLDRIDSAMWTLNGQSLGLHISEGLEQVLSSAAKQLGGVHAILYDLYPTPDLELRVGTAGMNWELAAVLFASSLPVRLFGLPLLPEDRLPFGEVVAIARPKLKNVRLKTAQPARKETKA